MKAIFATVIAMSVLAGVAGQASAATSASLRGRTATQNIATNDYDNPPFGSQQWWQQQEDRA